MNILKLFRAKKPAPTTMDEVLGKDTVKQLLADFIDNQLPEADGIIILWAAHDDVFIDAGGFSEAEALGALTLGQHMIIDKGLSKR